MCTNNIWLFYYFIIHFVCRYNLRLIYDLWHFGNTALGIRPYGKIKAFELRSKNERKNSSMAKFLVACIGKHLNLAEYLRATNSQRDAIFSDAWSKFEQWILEYSSCGSIKNLEKIGYTSVYAHYISKNGLTNKNVYLNLQTKLVSCCPLAPNGN